MTLDDLERPFGTLFQTTSVLEGHHENLNEDKPILSATTMQRTGNYADIRGGSLETRCQTQSLWGNRKRRFSGLPDATSSAPQEMRPTYYYIVLFSPLLPFHRTQNT